VAIFSAKDRSSKRAFSCNVPKIKTILQARRLIISRHFLSEPSSFWFVGFKDPTLIFNQTSFH
jgi:hypothetical protein